MEIAQLVEMARQIRERAYAPYSGYKVGAALMDERGQISTGCNVENISYGLSICAERGAVSAMVAGGGQYVREIAIVTADGGMPCGMCLQTLSEFAEPEQDLSIHCVDEAGRTRTFRLRELMPQAFSSDRLHRT